MNGVLVVDKPKGPTSHDVVQKLRRALRTRAIGHAGTLDPMATGVLVVAVGEATKLVPWLTSEDKGYVATLRLGVETDTLDAEGAETARGPVDEALLEEVRAGQIPERLEAALLAERARTEQIPPAYSAIRVDGQRAHELARKGQAPELAPRPIGVRRLVVTGAGPASLDLELDVTKGYFVRSLARDLAHALGTVGHLTALRRTRSGGFDLASAVTLEAPPEALAAAMLPVAEAAAKALPVSRLTEAGVLAASRGQKIRPEDIAEAHRAASAWLDASGRLVAIGEVREDGLGQVIRGFPAPAA